MQAVKFTTCVTLNRLLRVPDPSFQGDNNTDITSAHLIVMVWAFTLDGLHKAWEEDVKIIIKDNYYKGSPILHFYNVTFEINRVKEPHGRSDRENSR